MSGQTPAAFHPGRILVAMSDERAGQALTRWLEVVTDCDVTVVRDLRTAWSLRERGRWAAVIAEASLRDGPGLALLSFSKTRSPGVPTVLFSELDRDTLAMDAITFVDAHLPITVPMDQMRERLRSALGFLYVQARPLDPTAVERAPMRPGHPLAPFGRTPSLTLTPPRPAGRLDALPVWPLPRALSGR